MLAGDVVGSLCENNLRFVPLIVVIILVVITHSSSF